MQLPKDALPFLRELSAHNNREWFNEHKARYQILHEELLDFTQALIETLIPHDPQLIGVEPKNCLFRIYKDARFARDGAPYKTHFGIHIVSSGKRSDFNRAGFYLHIEPEASMMAGGAHSPSPEWLKHIRQHIARNPTAWTHIIQAPEFQNYFAQVQGEQLKRPPQGYTIDEPMIDWIKYKTLWVKHPIDDAQMSAAALTNYLEQVYMVYRPFQEFLNSANR